MNKSLNQVKNFHKTFSHPVLKLPQIPSRDRCKLRVDLLQEELDELKEAIKDNDLVEVADALSDLQFVLNGAVLEFGMSDKFDDINDEVYRSNMSKACKNKEEVQLTQKFYLNRGIETIVEENDNVHIVKRKSDNKILKNINYSHAKIKKILQ